MVRQKHTVKRLLRSSVLVLALAAAFIGMPGSASAQTASPTPSSQADVGAAVAGSYSLPCSPYGAPYYAFMQWVSGWGYHTGEDVCKGAGIPVYAAGDGVVVYSAKTPDSYRWGNLIMIEHTNPGGDKVVSLYGHLAANRAVGVGQGVGKGQLHRRQR
jgi:murein DD-endopeptidase MepM/ murein hydrolase activator NlpD